MDARRVLLFREIARHGSLSAAARALGWTQPAISQHLRGLEREVAQPLVVREATGVRLTDAGTALLRHADALAARLAAAEDELAMLADLRSGRLRIAAFPSAAATVAPRLMTELTRRYPDLDVRLVEVEPPEALGLLRAGDCDLAIVFDHAPADTDLAVHPVRDDPVRVVLAADHPLAAQRTVDLAKLARDRWIAGCARCRDHLLRLSRRAGFEPDIRHETDDYVVVQNLVAAGFAVALLPRLALDAFTHPGVSVAPVRGGASRVVSAVTVAGSDGVPAIKAAIGLLRTAGGRTRSASR
ncbi:LysR family transcriptional regulator [Allokutzneria albata]|uniref:LysR family transcriptional regulator n=1 Tax=Allokutzneria albata TaxID=211114 RepID=UPI0004C2C4AE|nr:LysR family transcriptional regulator [Allokutzneria albata]